MQELELTTVETEELEWVEGMRGSGDGRGRLDGLSCWQAYGETSRKIRRWVEILRHREIV